MPQNQHRPLGKDIFPAAASFAVTFSACMAVTFFYLTGGFPDEHPDRPAFVQDDETDIVAETEAAVVVAAAAAEPSQEAPAPPAESVAKTEARAVTSQAPWSPPPRVTIDTESIDSMLSMSAPDAWLPPPEESELAGGDYSQPQEAFAPPPEVVLDAATDPGAFN